MDSKKIIFFIILSCLVYILGKQFWDFLHLEVPYFVCEALTFCLMSFLIVKLTTGQSKIIAEGLFLLTISNLSDEVIFEPLGFQFFEYIFFIFTIVYTIHNLIVFKNISKKIGYFQ